MAAARDLDFDYPHMDIDNEAAFHDAGRLLLQLGHQRIALINGDIGQTFAMFRERGLRQALAGAGLSLPAVDDPVPADDRGGGLPRDAQPAGADRAADGNRVLQPDHVARRLSGGPRTRASDTARHFRHRP